MNITFEEFRKMNETAGITLTPEQEINWIKERLNQLEGDKPQLDEGHFHMIEFIKHLHSLGYPWWQIAAINLGLLSASIGYIIIGLNFSDIVDNIKSAIDTFIKKRKVNPQQIKSIANDVRSKINSLPSGKKRFMTSLLNKMEKIDPTNKGAVVRVQNDIERYSKQYGVK